MLTLLSNASCEDKKKASELKKTITTMAVDTLSISPEAAKIKGNSTEKKPYPKVSNENVIDFLTTYGEDNPETKVLITTQLGSIELELFEDAPLHRANFIYLVKQEYFNETFFYRVLPNFIIQGGNSDLRTTSKKKEPLLEIIFCLPNFKMEAHIKWEHFREPKNIEKTPIKTRLPSNSLSFWVHKLLQHISMEITPYLETFQRVWISSKK